MKHNIKHISRIHNTIKCILKINSLTKHGLYWVQAAIRSYHWLIAWNNEHLFLPVKEAEIYSKALPNVVWWDILPGMQMPNFLKYPHVAERRRKQSNPTKNTSHIHEGYSLMMQLPNYGWPQTKLHLTRLPAQPTTSKPVAHTNEHLFLLSLDFWCYTLFCSVSCLVPSHCGQYLKEILLKRKEEELELNHTVNLLLLQVIQFQILVPTLWLTKWGLNSDALFWSLNKNSGCYFPGHW